MSVSDDVASRLVGELEATGTAAEPGQFTLDEAAALRKLAEYRLADPHDWLCLVVEAATLLTALEITIYTRRSTLVVEFDGAAAGLDGLFGSVFATGPESSPSERARRKLAIALHALVAFEGLEQVTITDASGRLVIDPKQVDFTAESTVQTNASAAKTRLEVERRGRRWPELDRVRERCCYASLALVVDGEAAAFGLRHALDAARAGEDRWPILDQDRTIGWYGWYGGFPRPAELLLVCDGVLAERIPLDGTGDLAIIEGPFRKDIGETKVLRDDTFEHVMALVAAQRSRTTRLDPLAPGTSAANQATKHRKAVKTVWAIVLSLAFILMLVGLIESNRSHTQVARHETKEALDITDLSRGFAVALPAVQQCGRKHAAAPSSSFRFQAWIGSEGRVREVQLAPELAGTPLGICLEAALREASFPRFRGSQAWSAQKRELERAANQLWLSYPTLAEQRRGQAEIDRELESLLRMPYTQLVHWAIEF